MMRQHLFDSGKIGAGGIQHVRVPQNALSVLFITIMALFALGAWTATAQTAVIRSRPLTPQEKKSYPSSTQLAGGLVNVGVGQPLYLEALVTPKTTVVTGVVWTLTAKPSNSTATLQDSPITNDIYDVGDRNSYTNVGRKKLVPDVQCKYFPEQQKYTVKVDVVLTNKTISATNSFYGSVYMGGASNSESYCMICHGDKMVAFNQTPHASAFARKVSGSSSSFKSTCVSCHSVGYDTNSVATNGGFDDVMSQVGWTFPTNLTMTNMISLPSGWNFSSNMVTTNFAATNWAAVPALLQDKANIQCEACHGPADRHMRGMDTNAITVSLSAGSCGFCHDSKNSHIYNYEWSQTLHASGYVFRATGSCAPCHSARGFIDAFDSDYADSGSITNMPRGTGNEGITCAACHDPHEHNNPHQIRVMSDVNLGDSTATNYPYVYPVATITNGGMGKLCMNCHRVRNRTADYYVATTTNTTSFGVHHASQADMLAGKNAVEYGMVMPSSRHLAVVTNSCVECHMQETSTNALAKYNVGAHTFSLRWNAGTPTNESDDVLLTEACAECHGEIEDFNFGGHDYDRDGTVEGVQSEIEGLMNTLALLLPPVGSTNVTTTVTPTSHTLSQKKGLWNYQYVLEDGSHGVHNAKYTAAILLASIDDLSGAVGIDVDRDGLTDAWEIAKFGNLTSQTGSGDADSDGVSNAGEMAAGTNPNSSDTDGDGFQDLAEIEGSSHPTNSLSTLNTNLVKILPAFELAYMPQTLGVTQQLQGVDSLTGKSWTNVGESFVSSNTWFYRLWSTRDTTQQFFRVVTVP